MSVPVFLSEVGGQLSFGLVPLFHDLRRLLHLLVLGIGLPSVPVIRQALFFMSFQVPVMFFFCNKAQHEARGLVLNARQSLCPYVCSIVHCEGFAATFLHFLTTIMDWVLAVRPPVSSGSLLRKVLRRAPYLQILFLAGHTFFPQIRGLFLGVANTLSPPPLQMQTNWAIFGIQCVPNIPCFLYLFVGICCSQHTSHIFAQELKPSIAGHYGRCVSRARQVFRIVTSLVD